MSRNHHKIAHEIHHILRDIEQLEAGDIERIYGIIISEDGSVEDLTYQRKFESLYDWAAFSIEQEEVEYEEHFYGGHHYDDW